MKWDENQVRDYQSEQRRDARKLHDMIYGFHKRQLILPDRMSSDVIAPTLKIDIMPQELNGEYVEEHKLREYMSQSKRFIGLPEGLIQPTIDGVLINGKALKGIYFDQLYVGSNKHIGLRCDTINPDKSNNTLSLIDVKTRLSATINMAKIMYELLEFNDPFIIRLELKGVLNMNLHLNDQPASNEKSIATSNSYLIEKVFSDFGNFNRPHDIGLNLSHEMSFMLELQTGLSK